MRRCTVLTHRKLTSNFHSISQPRLEWYSSGSRVCGLHVQRFYLNRPRAACIGATICGVLKFVFHGASEPSPVIVWLCWIIYEKTRRKKVFALRPSMLSHSNLRHSPGRMPTHWSRKCFGWALLRSDVKLQTDLGHVSHRSPGSYISPGWKQVFITKIKGS